MPVADYNIYCEMLDRAQKGHYAYTAVNVTSLTTANAVLKGLAESRSDGIIDELTISTNRKENVMKKLTISGLALVFLLVSGTAWAGAESGLYLGGSFGSASLDVSDGGVEYDDDDNAYKIFGGYNFGIIPLINLAIEGSYVDFGTAVGNVAGNRAETSVTGWDLFGLVGVNLGPVSLFGKAGAINWDRESSFPSSQDDGTDPAYGVGLQLQIRSFAIRAEYELFTLDNVDIGFASAGVSYTF